MKIENKGLLAILLFGICCNIFTICMFHSIEHKVVVFEPCSKFGLSAEK